MPFLDIKVKEGIEHISDKEEEEGMEDDMDIYGVGVHCFTLTTLNVLITLWKLIWVSKIIRYGMILFIVSEVMFF